MTEYGTKELGEALVFVCELMVFSDNHLTDGVGWEDAPAALPALMKAPTALEGIGQAVSEASDLDKDEQKQLEALVDEKLGEGMFQEVGEQLIAASTHLATAFSVYRKSKQAN